MTIPLRRKPWKQETTALVAARILDQLHACGAMIEMSEEPRSRGGKRWVIAVAKHKAVAPAGKGQGANSNLLTIAPLGTIVVEWGKAKVYAPVGTRAVLEDIIKASH